MLLKSCSLPQLNAQAMESFHFLENHFINHAALIEDWFSKQWKQTAAPVYGSVDLRNAGFKIAPIDMNLFPAGFNNLNLKDLRASLTYIAEAIYEWMPQTKRILIIPESHTRNRFYWENIHTLSQILLKAGFEVRFALLDENATASLPIELSSGATLLLEPLVRKDNQLMVADFLPDMILLNNDLSEGIPAILENLTQAVVPPPTLGWSQRLKSSHFQQYIEVVSDFVQTIPMDSWLLAPLFRHCGEIDFMQQEGVECVISHAEILFAAIEAKYAEYHIPHQPFLIVKADAGTYGMAVMTVRNIEELRSLNRKQRTRMSTIKGGQPVRDVIIQEGIYTFETFGNENAVAEPVVYLWGKNVLGGFYRVHKERGNDENLNAPGMQFESLPFTVSCDEPNTLLEDSSGLNRFYLYGVVARLSMLAAAREMRNTIQQ